MRNMSIKLIFLIFILFSCNLSIKQIEESLPRFINCYGNPDIVLLGQSNANNVLATEIKKATGLKVCQIYHPGEPIENWIENGWLNEDLNFINHRPFRYLIWFQGEANAGYKEGFDFIDYDKKLENIINKIKVNSSCDFKVIIIGVYCTYDDMNNFRIYQKNMCQLYNYIYVDSIQFERYDGIHLSSEGARDLSQKINKVL